MKEYVIRMLSLFSLEGFISSDFGRKSASVHHRDGTWSGQEKDAEILTGRINRINRNRYF